MNELMPLEAFRDTETIKYGSAATSESANHAPLFIKEELNSLYNYTKMKFSEKPFDWDPRQEYNIGDYVAWFDTDGNPAVYIATAPSGNQEPPNVAWAVVDTDAFDLELKYVQIHTDKYINLLTRDSYKMMRANEDQTNAIMTPKNGLVPWDNETSTDLGTSARKFKKIWSKYGDFTDIDTNNIDSATANIATITATTVTADNFNGLASDSNLLDGYNTSFTADPNTVPVRNSSADIEARLFKSKYATQTSLTSSADICFRNNDGTDNYMRFVDHNGMINWIGKVHDSDKLDGYNSSKSATANTVVVRDANGDINGKASSAEYADLAEKYTTDVIYEPGTVLGFGGEKELTIYNEGMILAGVVSTNPGYKLNSSIDGTYIALKGRVPCKIVGEASKGQYIIANNNGFGISVNDYTFDESKKLLGVAISDSKDGIVEIKV